MVPDKPSYMSRFALKFVEILGAGLATAVSGYLVAHIGGYVSWPTKAAAPVAVIEALPSGSAKTAERPRSHATATAPAEVDAHAAAAHDDHAKEPAPAKAVEISVPATAAAASPADDEKHSRGASASHKTVSEVHPVKPAPRETTEAKARESTEAKAHETAEAKTREEEAVEERVRAALANVDASRAPLTPPPLAASPMPQTPAIPQPQPLIAPTNPALTTSAPSTAVPPAAIPPAPPQPRDTQNAAPVGATAPSAPVVAPTPAQQRVEPAPLTTVDIKSLPVAGVMETPPAEQASTQADNEPDGKTKETDKGFFSAITHLPDMLHANAHGPSNEPPRPPMPVGQ